jgi:hypothetical protein
MIVMMMVANVTDEVVRVYAYIVVYQPLLQLTMLEMHLLYSTTPSHHPNKCYAYVTYGILDWYDNGNDDTSVAASLLAVRFSSLDESTGVTVDSAICAPRVPTYRHTILAFIISFGVTVDEEIDAIEKSGNTHNFP